MIKQSNNQFKILPLHSIAHARAGDKGNVSNISLITYKPNAYDFIVKTITEKKVLKLFSKLGATKVNRYLLPNLNAINFVIENTLDGGVNSSKSVDRHGKTLSFFLLSEIKLKIPLKFIPSNSPYLF